MSRPHDPNELLALAERALEHAQGQLQATVVAQRDGDAERLTVEVTCVIDGRAARAQAGGTSDDELRQAARAAALHARRPRAWPTPGLPESAPERGGESAAGGGGGGRAALPELPGVELSVRTGAATIAIASTQGIRAVEHRSYAIAEARASTPGRTIRLRAAAPAVAALPVEELAEEALALRMNDRDPVPMPAGELHLVLGHDALAAVLDHLRPAFGVELDLGSGPLHGRFGTRVASIAVNLADAAGHPSTLARAFDAEGLPKRPVPLIQDGIAHGRVHDTASAARGGAASTGHATRAAALAPLPEHLVLSGGGASGIEALCAPVGRGLYVPALSPGREADGDAFRHTTHGAALIEQGEITAPTQDSEIVVDPLALLRSVEALSARTRTLPLPGHAPGGPGAAVVPSCRASAGRRC